MNGQPPFLKKQKYEVDYRIVIVGLVCLTTLEVTALLCGINGTLFTIVIIAIAGGIGVIIPQPKING